MRQLISQGLRRLVRQEPRHATGDKRAIVIAIATVKGGVGKTTTAVNLASGLAHFAHLHTLLIDLDAQGHCSTSLAASLPAQPTFTPISELLLSDEPRQLLDAAVATKQPHLHLTPADPALAEAEGRISQKIGKEFLLRDALQITRTHYDIILIDCPPNKGNLTLNALLAADHVIIPADLSPLAIQGAEELLDTALTVQERLRHELHILGLLLTRVDGRNTSLNQTLRAQLQERWGELLFQAEIGVNTQLAQAQQEGAHIFDFSPKSRGAEHYHALTLELLQRLNLSVPAP